jgi:hypothetical protein
VLHEAVTSTVIVRTSSIRPPEKYIINRSRMFLSTVERSRAAQVGEHAAHLAEHELKSASGKTRDTVQDTRRRRSQKLEDEAKNIAGVRTGLELAVLDRAEAEGVELAGSSVATEQNWVREVHAEDGVDFVDKTVSLDTVDEALGDGLIVAVVPRAVLVLVSTEESRDSLDVRFVVLLAVGVKLGQESSISVQKETGRAEEEVRVLFVLEKMLECSQQGRCVCAKCLTDWCHLW